MLVTLFRVKIKIQFRLSLMGDYQTANISKRNQKIRAQNYPESKALQNGNTVDGFDAPGQFGWLHYVGLLITRILELSL